MYVKQKARDWVPSSGSVLLREGPGLKVLTCSPDDSTEHTSSLLEKENSGDRRDPKQR